MARRALISDSTPLIALARIGELELVRSLVSRLVIPSAVAEEIIAARDDAPGAREVAEAEWIERENADPGLVRPLLLLLDKGEAEAIAVAQGHPGSIILTDDRKARRVAKQMGIATRGTLGLLAKAKREGLIRAVRPFTDRLQATGYRISQKLLEEFLQRLGE